MTERFLRCSPPASGGWTYKLKNSPTLDQLRLLLDGLSKRPLERVGGIGPDRRKKVDAGLLLRLMMENELGDGIITCWTAST